MALSAGDASAGSGGKKKKKKPQKIVKGTTFTPSGGSSGGNSGGGSSSSSGGSSYSSPSYYNPPTTYYYGDSSSSSDDYSYSPSSYDPATLVTPSEKKKPKEKKEKRQKGREEAQPTLSDVLAGIKGDLDRRARPENYVEKRPEDLERQKQFESLLRPAPANVDFDKLRQLNNMPEGQEISLPQRYKHKGRNKNNKLNWWWDKELIQARLATFEDAGDDFGYQYTLSEAMDNRYKDKESFAFTRLQNRSDSIKRVLAEARDQMYQEGNLEYLENFVQKHPNFELEPFRYREDYGITPSMLREEMDAKMKLASTDEERAEILGQYENWPGSVKHYEDIQGFYGTHRRTIQRQIRKFEQDYDDYVDDRDIEDAGPAIPEFSGNRDTETQDFIDEVVSPGNLLPHLGRKEYRKQRIQERQNIESELGIKLPNIQQMLEMSVMMGDLDPNDDGEVFAAIDRLRNPMHPDTRGLYATIARAQNPDLKDKELLDFINRPYMQGVKQWQEKEKTKAENAQIDQRISEIEDSLDFDLGLNTPGDTAAGIWDIVSKADVGLGTGPSSFQKAPEDLSKAEKRQWYMENNPAFRDYIFSGDQSLLGQGVSGGLAWTFDKLLRANYAMAGAYKSLNDIDQDDTPWTEGDAVQNSFWLSSLIGGKGLLGKNPLESLDEIIEDPSKLKEPFKEGYRQFFRGSGLPGTSDDTKPVTFTEIIQDNAEADSEQNKYDSTVYQYAVGFLADVLFDPTTYVGVGTIGSLGKLGLKASKGLSREAVDSLAVSQQRMARMVYGHNAEDMLRLTRMQKKLMPKKNWVSRLANPHSSRISDVAWRARNVLGTAGVKLRNLGSDVPFLKSSDLPPITDDPAIKAIDKRLDDLNRLDDAMNNDIAVQALREQVRENHVVMSDYAPAPGQADILVERVAGKAAEKKVNLYDFSKRAEKAAEKAGVFRRTFFRNPKGEAARKASDEADELRKYGDSPANRKQLDELERIAGEGSKLEPDVIKFLQQGGKLPADDVAKVREVFASSAGVKPEDLPFTDNELLEALAVGRTFSGRSDPEFLARMQRAYQMKNSAEKEVESLLARGKDPNSPEVLNSQRAVNTALNTLNNGTISGAIHHLRTLEEMGTLSKTADGSVVRVPKNPIYSDPQRAQNLQGLLDEVGEARVSTGAHGGEKYVATGGKTDTSLDASDDIARSVENPYFSEDLETSTLDELISKHHEFYPDRDSHLRAIEQALKSKLKNMRLDSGGRLKGLPPMAAATLKAKAPARFLGKDGKLDENKIMRAIQLKRIESHSRGERYEITYKKDVYDQLDFEGKAFLRNFTMTLRDRYNDLYTKRNLQLKSEETGYDVFDKAKNVFTGKGPAHVVALGIPGLKNASFATKALEKSKKFAKTMSDDIGQTYDAVKTSTLQNRRRIHQAIKQSDKDGVPPVVYAFTEKPLNHADSRFVKDVVDYARMRGVTVYHMQRAGRGRPEVKRYLGTEEFKPTGIPDEFDPSAPIKPTERNKRSAWAKANPEGFKSSSELMQKSLESGQWEDFFDAVMSAGAPFNLTDKTLTQVDDVIRERLSKEQDASKALAGSENVPKVLSFMGERLPYNLKLARREMKKRVKEDVHNYPGILPEAEKVLERSRGKLTPEQALDVAINNKIVEPGIRKWAKEWYNYITGLDPKAQVKLFNDLWDGAKKSAAGAAKKERSEALRRSREALQGIKNPRKDILPERLLTPEAYSALRQDTLEEAVEDLVKEVNERGALKGTASAVRARIKVRDVEPQELEEFYSNALGTGTRRTVNESARDAAREIKEEYALKRADLELKAVQATNAAERKAIKDEIAAIQAERKAMLSELEKARTQALEAKKQLRKDDIADALIQLTYFPGRDLTEAQAHALIAAKRADLENVGNKLAAPEIAQEAAVHRWFQNRSDAFKKFFRRPSAQLKAHESREILALVTGATPVLIKSHLDRISGRMAGMMKENRKIAFDHVRAGTEYQGPQREYFAGVKEEMDEIVDIWNGDAELYRWELEGRPGESFVTWDDLVHWLPKGYMPDLNLLAQVRRKRPNGKITINDLFQSIPNRHPEAMDPAVFAHTFRIAAGQARETRVAKGLINMTFGVPRIIDGQDGNMIEQLGKLGWETVEELGNTHYFHPAAAKEIRNLTELITKRDKRRQFSKMMDGAISSWKGLHTTYSPPYYVRNFVGESLMAWLGGVNNPKYFARSAYAVKWLKGQDRDLADLVANLPILKDRVPVNTASGGRTAFTLKNGYKGTYEQAWALYVDRGLKSTFTNTEIRAHGARAGAGALFSDRKLMRAAKKKFNQIHDVGEYADDYVRFAHFLHALEHSGRSNLNSAATYAAQRVRKYHFDYSDVSTFEKVFIGRAFPFYKWTRFAAPVLLSHMFLKPGKVVAPIKGMSALAGTLNASDMSEDTNGHLPDYHGMAPAWVKDLFAYQIGGMPGADDQYATYLRMATPQTDALLAAFQPSDAAMSLLNPAIKSAIELSMNQGMDRDFGEFPIVGGEYNEMNEFSPMESLAMYFARQTGPFTKSAADLYRDSQVDRPGHELWKQMVSNLSGVNLYQAKVDTGEAVDNVEDFNVPKRAVGPTDLKSTESQVSGPQPAYGVEGSDDSYGSYGNQQFYDFMNGYNNYDGFSNFYGYSGGFGSYGSGGYSSGGGYGGSGYGYSLSRQPWSDSLMQLMRILREQIDQGDVVDE